MAEVPNSLALSGSSLVVLSVLAFALEHPILSVFARVWPNKAEISIRAANPFTLDLDNASFYVRMMIRRAKKDMFFSATKNDYVVCLFVECFGVCSHSPHSSESRVISYMCFPCIPQRWVLEHLPEAQGAPNTHFSFEVYRGKTNDLVRVIPIGRSPL